ncbi:MAG TPA: hypothetical protein VII93_00090, partial [Anaerolineales bacterium]
HASVESRPPALNNEPESPPQPIPQTNSLLQWWKAITKKQWAFLIAMFVIWVILVAIFLIVMIKGQV